MLRYGSRPLHWKYTGERKYAEEGSISEEKIDNNFFNFCLLLTKGGKEVRTSTHLTNVRHMWTAPWGKHRSETLSITQTKYTNSLPQKHARQKRNGASLGTQMHYVALMSMSAATSVGQKKTRTFNSKAIFITILCEFRRHEFSSKRTRNNIHSIIMAGLKTGSKSYHGLPWKFWHLSHLVGI